MTLDEITEREYKIAEENQKIVDTQIVFDDVSISELYFDDTDVIEEHLDNYKKCAEYHKQIAECLKDYKHIKQWKSDIMNSFCKYDVSSFEELVTNVRNKVIDDFVTKYKSCDNRSIQCKKALNCADCIAEQLKAGFAND